MNTRYLRAKKTFYLCTALSFFSAPAAALPVENFTETGTVFEFTVEEDFVSSVTRSFQFPLGTKWQGFVDIHEDIYNIYVDWQLQHIIEVTPTAGGSFNFPGEKWSDALSGSCGFMDGSVICEHKDATAIVNHAGGTFPGGAIGSGVDIFSATLELKPSGTMFDIGGYTFKLTGRHVGIPEPGTLALLGIGLAGLAWRRSRHCRLTH